MYTISALALAFGAVAATAVALPQEGSEGDSNQGGPTSLSIQQAQEQCNGSNNGQNQVSCCNSESSDGLLSILDDLTIVGGQCSQISIPIAVLGSVNSAPVQKHCSNQVACCPAGTDGSSTGCSIV